MFIKAYTPHIFFSLSVQSESISRLYEPCCTNLTGYCCSSRLYMLSIYFVVLLRILGLDHLFNTMRLRFVMHSDKGAGTCARWWTRAVRVMLAFNADYFLCLICVFTIFPVFELVNIILPKFCNIDMKRVPEVYIHSSFRYQSISGSSNILIPNYLCHIRLLYGD